MPNDTSSTAVLLLAAGASTRLGYPKQLVEVAAQSLLEMAAVAALDSGCRPVVVVLGAFSEKIRPVIEHLPIQIVENKHWESGMGSSIACGMQYLGKEFPELAAVVLMLCDQPFVRADTLAHLVERWRASGAGIVASEYGGTFGPPALFERRFFAELGVLEGETGAKSMMLANKDAFELVSFPEGAVDLDTEGDLEGF